MSIIQSMFSSVATASAFARVQQQEMPKGRPCSLSSAMARSILAYVPSPRRASVVASLPSAEMAGTKFATRIMSWQNASSMRVALVKQRNAQSWCFSHKAMRSFRRTRGSPPV